MHQAPGASCDIMHILVLSQLLLMRSIHVYALSNLLNFSFTCWNLWWVLDKCHYGESWLAIECLYVDVHVHVPMVVSATTTLDLATTTRLLATTTIILGL